MSERVPNGSANQEPSSWAFTIVIVVAIVLLLTVFLWILGALNPITEDFMSGTSPTIEAPASTTPASTEEASPSPANTQPTPTEPAQASPTGRSNDQESATALVYFSYLDRALLTHNH